MSANIYSETIVAVATGQSRAALGVVRLSGPEAFSIVSHVWRGKSIAGMPPRSIAYGSITDGGPEVIDDVVLTKFAGPHSFTGEDVIEIAAHGSPSLLADIVEAMVKHGARPATAGEYTRRAFLNGKMDLAQAEAVADMIASESRAARRVALQQMRGGVSRAITEMREKLLHFAALTELELDFAEEDVAFADRKAMNTLLTELGDRVGHLLATFAGGRAMKDGIRVAIIGKPNAGKSTLLNLLLQDDRAIVSPTAGTTRDTIEDTLPLGDYVFRLTDTAGLRETQDEIEAQGIARSMATLQRADLAIYLYDATEMQAAEADSHLQHLLQATNVPPERCLVLATHAEHLIPAAAAHIAEEWAPDAPAGHHKSVSLTSPHMAALTRALHAHLLSAAWHLTGDPHYNADTLLITNARHAAALQQAQHHLNEGRTALHNGLPTDLLAHHLRLALHDLSTITGHISPDDILGEIFGKFCIGK